MGIGVGDVCACREEGEGAGAMLYIPEAAPLYGTALLCTRSVPFTTCIELIEDGL